MDLPEYRVSPFLFLGCAFIFAGVYFFSPWVWILPWALTFSILFGWLASIQILNRYASLFPPRVARGIHWIHAMSFEGFAVAGIVLSHMAHLFGLIKKPVKFSSGRPILLVHGYFNDSSVWLYQQKQLQEAGLGPIYTIDLGYPFLSIVNYAEKVAEKAELIAEETGRDDLVLIGYSMGGLVSAWYALKLAPPGKVTDLITIGAPFAGTPIARIGIGRNAREMQCNSDFIKKTRLAIESNSHIRFYHILSKSDELVFPAEKTALLGKDQARQLIVEDVGHAGLIYSNQVSQQLCSWLKDIERVPK